MLSVEMRVQFTGLKDSVAAVPGSAAMIEANAAQAIGNGGSVALQKIRLARSGLLQFGPIFARHAKNQSLSTFRLWLTSGPL